MALNKNALIRYRTIDRCLRNQFRQWTLDDLMEACSDALYEYEGRDANVSKRTIQLDLQMMRGDKLGYNAPIEVYQRKYYRYADPDYSITEIPITESDMQVLSESVEVLRQFKDFSLFSELGGLIQRLEDKVNSEKKQQRPIIFLDKNEKLKGLEHLDTLYQSILKKLVLKLTYKSFKASEPSQFVFHPFILKEFNNRWFVVGRKEQDQVLLTLALDRIIKIEWDTETPYSDEEFDGEAHYAHTIGVTVLEEEQLHQVKLKIDRYNAPYVLTKPFHSSQVLEGEFDDGSVVVSIRVHLNFELERLLLGFGNSIEVLAPQQLRSRVAKKLKMALEQYGEVE